MTKVTKKLLLITPIREQRDLLPIVESAGWYTVKDLLRKTGTSYNTHWNGKYVLDQDEIPWNATDDEILSLKIARGQVVVLLEAKYRVSNKLTLLTDVDGSYYVLESDVEKLLKL